jgi:hypothetical protein
MREGIELSDSGSSSYEDEGITHHSEEDFSDFENDMTDDKGSVTPQP